MSAADGPGRLNFAHVLPHGWRSELREYLRADAPTFDVGGYVVGDKPEVAHLFCKSKGVLAGIPFFNCIFEELGCTVEWFKEEGAHLDPSAQGVKALHIATVRGPARKLLLGERTSLNILARASGVARGAAEVAKIARDHGWAGQVVGTRKVTPGFRLVEKYSLLVGGCGLHRMDLSSMVMLKDNHIWSAGSITRAVEQARVVAGFSLKIEVEAQNIEEAREAAQAGAEVVMLDNFSPQQLAIDAEQLKREFPHLIVEASGGITCDTLRDYLCPGVDVLSMGSLTQGYSTVDFSLKIRRSS